MKLIFTLICVSFSILPKCQTPFTLRALYDIKMDQNFTFKSTGKPLEPLDFEGVYLVKGSRVISYLKPLYIGKYPNNEIVEEVGPNNTRGMGLNTDSIISICYSDSDSLIWRGTNYVSMPNMQEPYSFNYEPGFRKWEILAENKNIDGLNCQRAINRMPNGNIQFDVWFCPTISVPRGFDRAFELPGLIVEGEIPAQSMTIKLKSYETGVAIADSEFWPPLFNKKFTHRGTIKNKNKTL